MPDASTRLLSRVDAETLARAGDWLDRVQREQRQRLVNRLGTDVPLQRDALDGVSASLVPGRLAESGVRFRALAQLEPAGVPILVGLDGILLSRVVGALLGGGPLDEGVAAHRPLTRTDLRLGNRIVDDLLRGFEKALPTGCQQRPVVIDSGETRTIGMSLPSSTHVVLATLRVGSRDDPLGHAIIAFPASMVATLWPGATGSDGASDLHRVLPMQIEAVAELARVRLPLSELNRLRVGDTLDLGRLSEVVLRVRGEPTLVGEPGTIDGVRCVRVRARTNSAGG